MRGFKLLLVVIGLQLILSGMASNSGAQLIEGAVNDITQTKLYIKGNQYPISEDVDIYIGSEKGAPITLKTITGVGFIDNARVYIESGAVVKIVILEVSQ